jgi:hypothetical protein
MGDLFGASKIASRKFSSEFVYPSMLVFNGIKIHSGGCCDMVAHLLFFGVILRSPKTP